MSRQHLLQLAGTVVVKVGSRVLTAGGATPDLARMDVVARGITSMIAAGKRVLLVSSGAVAAGMGELGVAGRPRDMPGLQAVAAVGQARLMWEWRVAFRRHGRLVAQVLLTPDVTRDRARRLNARNTLFALLERGVVPVINENDTVAVEEMRFSDNDHLSALVVALTGAQLLVILSDVDGLFTEDPARRPDARPIAVVDEVTDEIMAMAGESAHAEGRGGMRTKVEAARQAAELGAGTLIVSGCLPDLFTRLDRGENLGTFFRPAVHPLPSRKHWLFFHADPRGRVFVDAGAARAIEDRGSSLLPSGVTGAEGGFTVGDLVSIVAPGDREIARGLSAYAMDDVERIKGRKSSEIETILGRHDYDEIVHRDNLVLMGS